MKRAGYIAQPQATGNKLLHKEMPGRVSLFPAIIFKKAKRCLKRKHIGKASVKSGSFTTAKRGIMRHIYYLAYIIYLILIISLIFFDQRKPLKRFSWILVLTFFPGLGLLLYWFIGSDSVSEYRKRIIRQRHGKILNQLNEIVAETDSLFNMPSSTGLTFHKKYCGSIYTGDNNVDIFTAGADKYKELFQDLEAAGESIHVIYFTIHRTIWA